MFFMCKNIYFIYVLLFSILVLVVGEGLAQIMIAMPEGMLNARVAAYSVLMPRWIRF